MGEAAPHLLARGRRLLALAAVVLATAAAVAPAHAGGRTLEPAPSPWEWRAAARPLDSPFVVDRELGARGAVGAARRSAWGGPVVTSTGDTVTLYVSDSFARDEAARTTWANFFAWLYHGPELSTVTIYQTTLAELQGICGAQAAGCYSPAQRVLIFPGDLPQPVEADIAAHEYGHHVAASRSNDPWDAEDWGPKRWATFVGVCSRAVARTAFPGDEGAQYQLNTGEAFAETNRLLNIQRGGSWAGLPLVVSPTLAPTPDSMAEALADIRQPWTDPASSVWDGLAGHPAPVVRLSASVGAGRLSLHRPAPTGLSAGVFAITVRDGSARDNFHLTGPAGLNRRTGVQGTSTVVWKVALQPGVYRFRSDAHPRLGGSFTVASASVDPAALDPQDRTVATPLDGTFAAFVSGPSSPTLELLDAGTGNVLVPPAPAAVSFTVCGQRSVVLRVTPTQPGPFHVEIQTP